jgi:class 3 adenylate cyclase
MSDFMPPMRFIALVLLLLTLCAGPTTQAAAQDSPGSGPSAGMAADATRAQTALIPWASIVKDEAGNKTAEEVTKEALAGHSKRLDSEVFSTNFSATTYWFVVPLENKQTSSLKRLLVVDPSWLDEIQATLTDAQGAVQTFAGGKTYRFAQRSEPHRLTNVALTLPPGQSTLVVRIQTRGPFFVNMKLMTPGYFTEFAAEEALYFGLLYGGLLSLLLFNLVLYLSGREKTYLAYCGLLIAFLLMHSTYNGHLFRWLLPESPKVGIWPNSIFIYLYCFAGLVFALMFLDLKAKLPVAYLWTRRLLYTLGLSFVASAVLGGYRAHVIVSILWVVLYAVIALALALLSLQRQNTAANFYLYGSAGGLVGSSITALTVMGIVPYSSWAFRAVDFGMLLDAIMLSLALSARVVQARRLERLRRFFSPAVADQLLAATSEELYRPHRREIVVLFLDLRGYTAFTQTHAADDVMRILGEFHAAMGELIGAYEATLERFAGDGMMIFLNDPVEIPDPAVKAGKMALDMQARFQELNKIWQQRNYSLSMGIGIAQGVATIGAIGFEGRRDYAAIGNVTNLAARLCSEADPGQILACSVVAGHVEAAVPVQRLGALILKGFSDPVECYEIAPLPRQKTLEPVGLAAAALVDLQTVPAR